MMRLRKQRKGKEKEEKYKIMKKNEDAMGKGE